MGGFIWPFVCGATVVHLRTLRPEFIRDAFTRYKITSCSLVPMVLKSLEKWPCATVSLRFRPPPHRIALIGKSRSTVC